VSDYLNDNDVDVFLYDELAEENIVEISTFSSMTLLSTP
jgi:hypothetical protein